MKLTPYELELFNKIPVNPLRIYTKGGCNVFLFFLLIALLLRSQIKTMKTFHQVTET